MIPNALKKMIIFSSEKRRKVLENAIKDRAAVANCTESAVIDQALSSYLLPQNQDAAMWVELLYDGDTLSESYARAFSYLASGTMWGAKHTNGQPLVTCFCRLIGPDFYRFQGDENLLSHFISQLESIAELLPETSLLSDKKWLEHQIKQLRKDPQDVDAQELIYLIHRQFEHLKDNTRTYRALADLARIAGPSMRDTAQHRTAYIDALKSVSAEW